MEKMKISGLLFLFAILVGFTSCDPDPYFSEDPDYWLCNNVWVDDFAVDSNTDCYQELVFYPNGRGVDRREYYYYWENETERVVFNFYWSWDPSLPNSLIMEYPDGDSYFDNVRITQYQLSGVLDGERVIFDAK